MRAPIIVVSDDTDVFATIEAAERYLEPWSVESGTLRIYDRDGRPLVAQIAKTRILKNEVVTLSDPGAAPEPDALIQALADFLTARGVEVTEEGRFVPLDRLWERGLAAQNSLRLVGAEGAAQAAPYVPMPEARSPKPSASVLPQRRERLDA